MKYYQKNVIILSFTIFLAAVSWNQIIPFLPLFLKQIGAGNKILMWTGIIFSLQAVASIFGMPFWGKMGDKYGRKPMILRAGFFLTIIYYGMSFCNAPWQLAILRFMNGGLTGFIPGSIALIATNTPQEFAPKNVATAQCASAAGQILGPALGGILALLVGYRGSMKISAMAIVLAALMVLFIVKEPNKPKVEDKTSLFQDFIYSIKTPLLASLMLLAMINGFFVMAVNPFLVIHLKILHKESPDWLNGIIYAVPALAMLLTTHTWINIGAKKGYKKTINFSLICFAIFSIVISFIRDLWMFTGLYFVCGIFLASIQSNISAITVHKVEESFRGRAFGMQISASVIGAFIAPIFASYIGNNFGVNNIFMLCGFVIIIGFVAYNSRIFRMT